MNIRCLIKNSFLQLRSERRDLTRLGVIYSSCLIALLTLILWGCSSENSVFLVPRPDPTAKVKDKVGDINLIFKPQIDILFVIDDSGSMDSHQNNLATNMDLFTDDLQKVKIVDYHIGVTTTDFSGKNVGELKGRPIYIENSTPDGFTKLKRNLLVGTKGSPYESVFEPTRAALSEPNMSGVNKGFYREDAYLAVVFVTDAVDQSKISAAEMYKFLMNLKGWNKPKVITYGVIVPSGERECDRDEQSEPKKIEEFLYLAGGTYFSLCSPDYGQNLAAIGKDLVKRIGMFIPLKQIPVVSTIRVRYGKQVIPESVKTGWSYDPYRVGINLGAGLELEEQAIGTELEIDFVPALLDPQQ